MNKIDEFWYILTKAILNKNEDMIYLYDRPNDLILSYLFKNNNAIPYYKNEELKQINSVYRNNVVENFDHVYSRFTQNDSSIFKLKAISDQEKKQFLDDFIFDIEDSYKKQIIECVNINNLEKGGSLLSKINFEKSMTYSNKLGIFLNEKFLDLYFPLGISTNTNVVW
ncbi:MULTISPECIES: hypothetical protein [unclassified Flavobacterium]|uniref:hypothetical protein n=1 Tax=unclassified Flavobacterium TaxID=196869 RepID=UPI002B22C08D|nr:hypothetical protein [Flavobacterium sp. PL02]MEA9414465.1 hypothetical protein [Flavobacterium sp. PL02]